MPARPAGPRLADPPPRPDPRARACGPERRRTVRTVAAAARGVRARLNARPNRPRGRPATHPLFPPERRRTFPHARIPPESDADALATPETGPESHWWEFLRLSSSGGNRSLYGAAEPLYSIYYKLRRERGDATDVRSLIRFMLAFYDNSGIFAAFDRLRSGVKGSTTQHSGIDRILRARPANQGLNSKLSRDTLERASSEAREARHRNADLELDQGIVAAFEANSYGKVLELVDRYLAEGWDKRAGFGGNQSAAYLAHMQAEAHFGLGAFETVISIGREVLERLRDSRKVSVPYHSACVLCTTVAAIYEAGRYWKAIDYAAMTMGLFDKCKSPEWQRLVADVMGIAARAHAELDDIDAAISVLDCIEKKYGESDKPEIKYAVATALSDKADILSTRMNDPNRAILVYDALIARHRESDDPESGTMVGGALLNRAFLLGSLGRFEEEIANYDTLLDCAAKGKMPDDVSKSALAFKCWRLAELGRADDALTLSAALERDFGGTDEDWGRALQWIGLAARAVALTVRRQEHLIDAIRAAYARFPANNEVMTRLMVRFTLNLVAVGASEEELSEVLASNGEKTQSIAPLVAALSMSSGGTFRAPAEVLGVAADIRKTLDEKSARGILRAF